MGGGQEAAFCFEGDLLGCAYLLEEGGDGGFEVAEAGVRLFAGEFDARGKGHVGLVEKGLLIGDLDHLVLGHAGGEDGAEGLVIEKGECAARGVSSSGCATSAGLDAFDVFEVVAGDRGSPWADGGEMSGDLGKGFDVVGFVTREGWARVGSAGGDVTVEDGGEGFGVSEGVVDAGLVTVLEVVRAAVEEIVVGAGGHKFDVAIGSFTKAGVVVGEEDEGGMAAVAGAASPPGPLVVAGAPGVVPGAVGEHELHVGSQGCDGFFQDGLVVCEQGVLGQCGQGFFYVVAEVDWAAVLGGDGGLRVAFAEEEIVFSEVVHGRVS